MDRVHLRGIPGAVRDLEELKDRFVGLDSRADWAGLGIEPLLAHARALEREVRSKEFARETSRLRRGVGMFRADLVYFRDNIRELRRILAVEKKTARRGS